MSAVREFHEAFGLPAPASLEVPDARTLNLRSTLLREEWEEVQRAEGDFYLSAIQRPVKDVDTDRLVDLAKELADLRYVADGYLVTLGLDPDVVFEIVHDSNMSKLAPCLNCRGRGTVPDPDDDYGSGDGPYYRLPCENCKASGKTALYRPDGKVLKGPDYHPAEPTLHAYIKLMKEDDAPQLED